MARKSKLEDAAFGIFIIFALILGMIINFIDKYGWITIILILVACAVVFILFVVVIENKTQTQFDQRQSELMDKYGNFGLVSDILSHKCWIGQTSGELLDSFGPPEARDQKILKTKTKETWKWGQHGHNRYIQKVVLEDGVVVGWDIKK